MNKPNKVNKLKYKKFKEMFYVDYSLAHALIQQYELTINDREKINNMRIDKDVKKAIFEILESE